MSFLHMIFEKEVIFWIASYFGTLMSILKLTSWLRQLVISFWGRERKSLCQQSSIDSRPLRLNSRGYQWHKTATLQFGYGKLHQEYMSWWSFSWLYSPLLTAYISLHNVINIQLIIIKNWIFFRISVYNLLLENSLYYMHW